MIDLTVLVRGIPLYMWLAMAMLLLATATAIYLSIPDDEPRRDTTSAGNPTRKRGWGP